MKIYVAGNYKWDRDRVSDIADVLEVHGHTITYKWWMEQHNARNKSQLDLAGVSEADALVVLMEDQRNYRGTWCEVGAALVLGKPVYFIGDCNSDLIFRQHPNSYDFRKHFPDREAAEVIQ